MIFLDILGLIFLKEKSNTLGAIKKLYVRLKNEKDCMIGNFDSKSDEGISLSYSSNNSVYHVYNMRTQTIMEYANVIVDEFNDFLESSKEEEITSLKMKLLKYLALTKILKPS